ncbi:MAG: 50S ribosomal protein L4 [Proteobacteria bacterium]|nr:50S ribosomal protein L4 [Pseudomonadota bacterium]
MPTLPIYDVAGTQVGESEVPDTVFGATPGEPLLHQAVLGGLAAQRQGTAHTKTRAEVSGSGRKLWRQKGTGRARVGDSRPPNRVGGGAAMAPRMRSHRQRLSVRFKRAALRSALSARAGAGDIMLIEPFELVEQKTKAVNDILVALGAKGRVLLMTGEPSEIILRCGRNISGLQIRDASCVNAYDVLAARTVIITSDAIPRLEDRLS